jgi:hypothetical protein
MSKLTTLEYMVIGAMVILVAVMVTSTAVLLPKINAEAKARNAQARKCSFDCAPYAGDLESLGYGYRCVCNKLKEVRE